MAELRTISIRDDKRDLIDSVDKIVSESGGDLSFSGIVIEGLSLYLKSKGGAA